MKDKAGRPGLNIYGGCLSLLLRQRLPRLLFFAMKSLAKALVCSLAHDGEDSAIRPVLEST